jgi:hypothetical protein
LRMDAELIEHFTRGRGLVSSQMIHAGHGLQFLAVDVVDRWGGAFGFALGPKGDAVSDGAVFYKDDDGSWEEAASGGGRWYEWAVPWDPREHPWDGRAILGLGSAGCELEDGDDEIVLVLVRVGFVRHDVVALEVENARYARRIEVTSPVGGFAVITIGEGEATMRALDGRGSLLDEITYN